MSVSHNYMLPNNNVQNLYFSKEAIVLKYKKEPNGTIKIWLKLQIRTIDILQKEIKNPLLMYFYCVFHFPLTLSN